VDVSPLTLLSQPDCPRTITWFLTSHNQISDFSLVISGVDSRGIIQSEKFTGEDGWAGETVNAYKSINSIVFTKVNGNGTGDKLNVGTGSKLGISRGIFRSKDIASVTKNGAAYSSEKYRVDVMRCTVDVSIGEKITAGDTFTIEYSSNFNDLLWLDFQ
jgi:hypothetical protein